MSQPDQGSWTHKLDETGWWGFYSCRIQDVLVVLMYLLSIVPCLYLQTRSSGVFIEYQAGRPHALIGCFLALSTREFSSTPPFSQYETSHHKILEQHISGYLGPLCGENLGQNKMATQYTTDIPFSSSHQQQVFKLLELPSELLVLLESDNPPMCVSPLPLPSTELMYSED
jgi:hypothetical protein